MNWDVIKGKWSQIKGDAQSEWGHLTDNDWEEIKGDKDKLLGKLQESYGWTREEAERRTNDWANRHYVS